MNLNLILPLKKIQLPRLQREVTIPKLSLKHYNLLREVKDVGENMQRLIDSICPGVTPAEADFVSLHILEFNGKIKSTVIKDGFEYKIDDVYISQRLEFQYQGNTFYFKAPNKYEEIGTVDMLLSKCFLRVNDSDEKPDFLKMPAFVVKWAEDLTKTLSIEGPNGSIRGMSEIVDLFNGSES